MPYKDPDRRREYERVRLNNKRAENRETYNAYQREWYAKNSEKLIAKTKAWRERNPDKVRVVEQKRSSDPEKRAQRATRMRAWAKRNPDKVRNQKLKAAYGITLEQYNELLAKQNGMCAICGSPPGDGRSKYLHVDHCHLTKKVRGLLCGNCNQGLGRFEHDVGVLSEAIRYLQA